MEVNNEEFLTFLEENNLLSGEKLEMAINFSREKNCSLWAATSVLGLLESDFVYHTVSDIFDLIFFELETSRVETNLEIGKFNHAEGQRLLSIPLFLYGDQIVVGMDNPGDIFKQEELISILGMEVLPILCRYEDILDFLNKRYPSNELDLIIEEMQSSRTGAASEGKKESRVNLDLPENPLSSPVIRVVNTLFAKAIKEKASDIHMEQNNTEVRLRYRIDGILKDVASFPRGYANELVSRIKILASLDISEKRLPQDGHIKLSYESKHYDLRVSTLPASSGEKLVLRILDKSKVLVQIKNLDFDKKVEKEILRICRHAHGLILVTGPTGSGKTTTLYGMLNQVNQPNVNIITIEDPVEYEIPGITQVQVLHAIQLNFSRALRAILRQDPNIILVGEIRDPETASIAIESSMTGHLLLSTLHTNDAASAIGRLIDMHVEPYLLSSTLLAVLAQRLLRRICPDCKDPLPPHLVEKCNEQGISGRSLAMGKGCDSCFQSGLKGRLGIHELLLPGDEIRQMINQKKPANFLKEAAIEKGMLTLREDGKKKIAAGLSILEELDRVVPE
ncbi:GspE/PulE family protein [Candidatus Riflebacteria bacterium]